MIKAAALLLTCCLAAPAFAATSAKPAANFHENRFVPLQDEASDPQTNDLNVAFWSIQHQVLPEFMATQLSTVLASCFSNVPHADDVQVFAYESEYNRLNGLPPNFIFDFSKLANEPQRNCMWSPLCSEQGCKVLGYFAYPGDRWETGFAQSALQWGVQPIAEFNAGGHRMTRSEIWTVSNSPQCPTPAADSESCLSDFAWANKRLTPITVQR